MNPELRIESHIMDAKRMDTLMLRDQPIVPPDSVIKTFPQLRGEHIDFAISQDKDGLSPGSFVLRRGEWSKFFLDTWFDPLYRSYNFQKAETHALVRYTVHRIHSRALADKETGAHRAMASNNSLEAWHNPPEDLERIQQR